MTTDIKTSEYESLRQEILQNKQFIFERPLAIIAAGGIAALQLSGSTSMLALPTLVILVLSINIWFTANRIRSNARIVSYISVMIEPGSRQPWIGWENALRLHRKWTNTYNYEKRKQLMASHLAFDAMPDAMMFYPVLLALHIVPVAAAFTAFLLAMGGGHALAERIMLVATILATSWFTILCVGPYRPEKMTHLIELQRASWLAVFAEDSQRPNQTSEPISARDAPPPCR